jgi:hypothetical protein
MSARCLDVTRGSFLACAHREVIVALVQVGLWVPLLCAVSSQGFQAAGVAWG